MKSRFLLRLLTCTALTIALTKTNFEPTNATNQAVSTDIVHFSNNNDLIVNALNNIKKHKTGHISRALCTYDLDTAGKGMAVKRASTKIYYSEYHKKPDLIIEDIQPEKVVDKTAKKIAEIFYNPVVTKKSVTFTVKDIHGHVIKEQELPVPAHCSL